MSTAPQPYPWSRVPRLTGGEAAGAIQAFLSHRCRREWPLTTGLLGELPRLLSLQVTGPQAPPPPSAPSVGSLILYLSTPNTGRVQLVLTGGFVRLLLDRMQAAPPDSCGRIAPLTPGEGGLLTGLMAAALTDLEAPDLQLQDVVLPDLLSLGGATAGTDATVDFFPGLGVIAQWAVGQPTGTVYGLLDDVAATHLRHVATTQLPSPLPGGATLRVTGAFLLARTQLVGSRLVDLAPQDVIAFPTHPLAPRDDPAARQGWLSFGPCLFPARLQRTDTGRQLLIQGEVESMDTHDSAQSAQPAMTTKGDLLDRLPVTLSVTLGQVELTAGDVARLAPGAVISLDQPIGDLVTVYAGSQQVARGELVSVDGAVGVRVTEVLL